MAKRTKASVSLVGYPGFKSHLEDEGGRRKEERRKKKRKRKRKKKRKMKRKRRGRRRVGDLERGRRSQKKRNKYFKFLKKIDGTTDI